MLRQTRLTLSFYEGSTPNESGESSAKFIASFYDPLTGCQVFLNGVTRFATNASGKVTSFEEHYTKVAVFAPLVSLEGLFSYIWRVSGPYVRAIILRARRIGAFFIRNAIIVTFGLFSAVTLYHQIWGLPAEGGMAEFQERYIQPNAVYVTALAAFAQKMLPFFNNNQRRSHLTVKPLSNSRDLDFMVKHLDGADKVQIISGNYSFLGRDQRLADSLKKLAAESKLVLYSYCSKSDVESAVSASSKALEIFNNVVEDGNFFPSVHVKRKITLVESGGRKVVLFRFAQKSDSVQSFHMGILNDDDETRYLVASIEEMFDCIRLASRRTATA